MKEGATKRIKLLIVSTYQFGYHTDTLMYCKYLNKEKFEVHYCGFDAGKPAVNIENVNIHSTPLTANKIANYFNYFKQLAALRKKIGFDVIFHLHTKFSLIIRLLFISDPYVLDIRTGYLNDNRYLLKWNNFKLKVLSLFSKNVTVISAGLSDYLKLKKGIHILPLGGEVHGGKKIAINGLHLVYVGTLDQRNLADTIEGLHLFQKANTDVHVKYEILGSGSEAEYNQLMHTIDQFNLSNIVVLHGYVTYSELAKYFENANVGIVYIPKKEYYENQPSTKLFEYLLSGIPVIATGTKENKLIVNDTNGVICEDNPADFATALNTINNRLKKYNSVEIINSVKDFAWDNIVRNNLENYFKTILEIKEPVKI